MKIGFLLNIVLLLCFICSQVLIWLLDGTLVHSLAQLLDKQSTVFRNRPAAAESVKSAKPSASSQAQSVQNSMQSNGVHYHHQKSRGKPTAYERVAHQYF